MHLVAMWFSSAGGFPPPNGSALDLAAPTATLCLFRPDHDPPVALSRPFI
jgi:hypothetical protein